MALDRVIDLSHEFSYIIFFVREILRSGFRNIFDSLRDIYIHIYGLISSPFFEIESRN